MNKQFNLENYETVKQRKQHFYKLYKDGRIIVDCIKLDEKEAQYKVTLFKDSSEQEKFLPIATGYAQEFKGQGGFANKTSWSENCEESAVGRALDNAGLSGNLKCSREEMIKVLRAEDDNNRLTGEVVHSVKLLLDTGVSKEHLFKKLEIKSKDDVTSASLEDKKDMLVYLQDMLQEVK